MLAPSLKELNHKKVICLDNNSCPYCYLNLGDDSDVDHVIGRNFVPRGTLENQWNLKIKVHKKCNNAKSKLEDDISAITMQPNPDGLYPSDNYEFIKDSKRKAKKSISKFTKKPVNKSYQNIKLNLNSPGFRMNADFTSIPQIADNRTFTLALLQLRAFFYWITYNDSKNRGNLLPGIYFPIHSAFNGDWGNNIQVKFMNNVVTWEPRVHCITADSFFKISIRRHPYNELWSFAIEWNNNLRIIGFFGDQKSGEKMIDILPKLNPFFIGKGVDESGKKGSIYMISERRLKEEDDKMFVYDVN